MRELISGINKTFPSLFASHFLSPPLTDLPSPCPSLFYVYFSPLHVSSMGRIVIKVCWIEDSCQKVPGLLAVVSNNTSHNLHPTLTPSHGPAGHGSLSFWNSPLSVPSANALSCINNTRKQTILNATFWGVFIHWSKRIFVLILELH